MADIQEIHSPSPKAADQKFCFSCGSTLHFSAASCPHCGALQSAASHMPVIAGTAVSGTSNIPLSAGHVFCRGCGVAIHRTAAACPKCGAVQGIGSVSTVSLSGGPDRVTAVLLAFFLGGLGVHKFYLGKIAQGIFYLLFFWTLIPAIIAFIEGVFYLTMQEDEFRKKYS